MRSGWKRGCPATRWTLTGAIWCLLGDWLAGQGRRLSEAREADLNGYFAARHAQTRATTANRRLTVFKRYFRWALRERLIDADPTLRLAAARQPMRVPKTLSEAQVEALLAAPDTATPLGQRDRAMLELMYASGLRVSELVTLKTFHVGHNEHVLRITGKGNKERLVPFGQIAGQWLRLWLGEGRAEVLAGRQSEDLFVTARGSKAGEAMSRVMFWNLVKKYARRRASRRRCRRTRCATPLRPICSTTAPIFGRCRCCWAIPTSRPPPSTPMWPGSA